MDDVDRTSETSGLLLNADIKQVQNNAAKIPVGTPGECERCGEDSLRLVRCECPVTREVLDACARCRDKYKLKVKES